MCQVALGVESGEISDSQVTASTEWTEDEYAARLGRLHVKDTAEHEGAWESLVADVNQWLQVDLGIQKTNVTLVATQGRNGFGHWVKEYSLQYSNNGVNFTYYVEQGQSVKKVKPFKRTVFFESGYT